MKKNPPKSFGKKPAEGETKQGEEADLANPVQKCGQVHMDFVQTGEARTKIPYKCPPPTQALCGDFDKETNMAKCCCVAPGYKGKILTSRDAIRFPRSKGLPPEAVFFLGSFALAWR